MPERSPNRHQGLRPLEPTGARGVHRCRAARAGLHHDGALDRRRPAPRSRPAPGGPSPSVSAAGLTRPPPRADGTGPPALCPPGSAAPRPAPLSAQHGPPQPLESSHRSRRSGRSLPGAAASSSSGSIWRARRARSGLPRRRSPGPPRRPAPGGPSPVPFPRPPAVAQARPETARWRSETACTARRPSPAAASWASTSSRVKAAARELRKSRRSTCGASPA